MKVLIGIPTTRSHSYIFASLERIIKEIRLCSKKWNMVVALCLNGKDYENKTEKETRRFLKEMNRNKGF